MTNNKQSLLPCPFCGGEVDPTGWLRGDGVRGPECEDCGATTASIEAWNTRTKPTEQDKAQGLVELPGRKSSDELGRGLMPSERGHNACLDAVQPLFDRVRGDNEELRDENEALSRWRELALQFDNHRMQALWHLKALLQSQEHVGAAHDFLDSPPLAAHEVVAERDALRDEVERLHADPYIAPGLMERTNRQNERLRNRVAVLEDLLRGLGDWINTLPPGTRGATTKGIRIFAALNPPAEGDTP